ncbi:MULTISPECIES: YtfJ family protein [unclassified Pasteurella]|uniref:YtfJ family protein n=1 Tax=unclassified Pasteurella TaxID=2621516 RepID=UPI001073B203|nr:YtfJ family protein [Pasteurella sp. 19428wF3_WM03]TFU52919.1 YtfJ family protein [Pasteurella sp. WM03]
MKKQMLIFVLGSVMLSRFAFAHNIQLEQSLPVAKVAEYGEIILSGKETKFQIWASSSLTGKVRVVHHLAGRSAAKEKNQAMIDAIKAAHFSPANYQTTTIINADDAIVGTGMFVKSSAEKGKIENPHSQVVLDDKSAVKNAWNLNAKDSAIIVLDKKGKVKFVKEGKLSHTDIQTVISLVTELTK